MNRQQNRMWKLLYVLFASFLIHSDGKHSGSTEPSSILHFDKALQWEQKVVGAFAFTPDGTTLVGCGGDWIDDASLPSGLRFWNVASGKSFLDLTVPNAKIISIVFSLDGNRLFSGSYDGIIRVHDLHARKTDVISDAIGQEIIMSPDGKRVFGNLNSLARVN